MRVEHTIKDVTYGECVGRDDLLSSEFVMRHPLLLTFAFNNCKNLDNISIALSCFQCRDTPLHTILENINMFFPTILILCHSTIVTTMIRIKYYIEMKHKIAYFTNFYHQKYYLQTQSFFSQSS